MVLEAKDSLSQSLLIRGSRCESIPPTKELMKLLPLLL